MRILHITSALSWRGGERQIDFLVDYLNKEGHEVYLLSPNESKIYQRSRHKFTSCKILLRSSFAAIANINQLKRICAEFEIDLIHAHDSFSHSLVWMAYRLGNLTTPSLVTRRLNNQVRRRSFQKYNHPKVQKLICVSKAVYDNMAPRIKDQERLEIIHSGINLQNKYEKQKHSGINIIYIAAFEPEKNHETFLAVAQELLNDDSITQDLQFTLIGSGSLFESIRKQAVSISDKILLTGFVEDVEAQISIADILLHTATEEALGTSILDCMKYGLPVVSSNVGGIPELVHEGKNGFLHKPYDIEAMSNSLRKLIESPNLIAEFEKNNAKIVQQFDKDKMAKKIVELYHEVIQ